MHILTLLTVSCSLVSEPVGPFNEWPETSEGWSMTSEPSESSTSATSSTAGPGSSETSPGEDEATPTQTPTVTSLEESSEMSGEGSSVTDTVESESTDGDGWSACDGEVPTACLGIFADVGSCPGAAGSCTWHSCVSDRNTRANIAWLECLADECGFEPALDIDCLVAWADLTLDCFQGYCDPALPHACGLVNNGAQHECQYE